MKFKLLYIFTILTLILSCSKDEKTSFFKKKNLIQYFVDPTNRTHETNADNLLNTLDDNVIVHHTSG